LIGQLRYPVRKFKQGSAVNKKLPIRAALALCLACGATLAGGLVFIPQSISFAVGSGDRPARDRNRDSSRKPELVLAFAGIKPGQRIGELMPGGGYFTRIFCQVAGNKGRVYTVAITPVVQGNPAPDAGAPAPALTDSGCTNVTAASEGAADLVLPNDLDVVWTSENYHDLHNARFGKPDMKALDSAIFKALKPGGVFIVEDHVAAAGSGARDTETLHRIDPDLVKQEVTSVGFVFEDSSEALHNDEDTHEAKVFDLKGRTDRFLFKFRKPKGLPAVARSADATPVAATPVAASPVTASPVTAGAATAAAVAAAPVTDSHGVPLKRATVSKIIGEVGNGDFVLQLTTPDGEVQYTMSRADLKSLASMASKYSQGK
jgi:predicted methyltransferase